MIELNKKTKQKSIWIVRDKIDFGAMDIEESIDIQNHLERHPENEYLYGKLHIFYERPCVLRGGTWIGARDMAEVPNYMFPEIKCEMCVEFKGNIPIEEDYD